MIGGDTLERNRRAAGRGGSCSSVGDRRRQDVLAQAQHLSELDVRRAEHLEPATELHRERQVAKLARSTNGRTTRRAMPTSAPVRPPRRDGSARRSADQRHQTAGQQPGEVSVGDEDPADGPQSAARARTVSRRAGVMLPVAAVLLVARDPVERRDGGAERQLAGERDAGDDLGELLHLAAAGAAEDLQALASASAAPVPPPWVATISDGMVIEM